MVDQEFCSDWYTWGSALHISSKAGGYIVSYLFFTLLAVYTPEIQLMVDCICWRGEFASCIICTIRKTQWDSRNQNYARRIRYPSFYRNVGAPYQVNRPGIHLLLYH